VPILRAGLVLLEQAGTVLPMSETYHVGYVRDETTLKVGWWGFGAAALLAGAEASHPQPDGPLLPAG
jgi:uracil phosphoribosyltransferase